MEPVERDSLVDPGFDVRRVEYSIRDNVKSLVFLCRYHLANRTGEFEEPDIRNLIECLDGLQKFGPRKKENPVG